MSNERCNELILQKMKDAEDARKDAGLPPMLAKQATDDIIRQKLGHDKGHSALPPRRPVPLPKAPPVPRHVVPSSQSPEIAPNSRMIDLMLRSEESRRESGLPPPLVKQPTEEFLRKRRTGGAVAKR